MIDEIRRLGVRPAARLLDVPHTTVWNWVANDRVPKWRWPQIEAALRTLEDFKEQGASHDQ